MKKRRRRKALIVVGLEGGKVIVTLELQVSLIIH